MEKVYEEIKERPGYDHILCLYGQGKVIALDHPEFFLCFLNFPNNTGTRAIIRVKIERIVDSCGMVCRCAAI